MMPQFSHFDIYKINLKNLAAGLSIFTLGLAKKILIADPLAAYVTPIFKAADAGNVIMFIDAWIGSLSYTLQLYFDFSGYCDMAIGLSLMLNIRMPMNFNSPYKATSIIDFWRRWHMTLSAFLRDYVYYPLGGNKKGTSRRYINLMATMLLGGLWHGAGWTFIIWGGLHGVYLTANHGWRNLKFKVGLNDGGRIAKLGALLITFLAIVVAWVFFRSNSLSGANSIIAGMSGLNNVSTPTTLKEFYPSHLYVNEAEASVYILVGLATIWLLPNLREVFSLYKPTWNESSGSLPEYQTNKLTRLLMWRNKPVIAIWHGVLLAIILIYMSAGRPSPFLYFQF
jgi:D-alanyl-lipoteichoic acid acyltransferase DltB (MBOAT superfamily)